MSCTDFHCDREREVQLTTRQWQNIRTLFTGTVSPGQERNRLRQAIALLEVYAGNITGTWRDLPRNITGEGPQGQLDCISESKNTTTYLALLHNNGLLRWHDIEERQVRHTFVFNAHWSAVIRDRISGKRYAVDSWFRGNGYPPYIQPLQEWKSGRRFDR